LFILKQFFIDNIKILRLVEVVVSVMLWLEWDRRYVPFFLDGCFSCLELYELLEVDESAAPSILKPVDGRLF
jgi:hypothetical protein